VYYLKLKNRS